MDNMAEQTNWDRRFEALQAFVKKEGHARVPTKHVVTQNGEKINLGTWVSYLRTRYKKNLLDAQQIAQLESLPGWEWGPLQPGPKSDQERDQEILTMFNENASLADIGRKMGLSRQRIHQIIQRNITV